MHPLDTLIHQALEENIFPGASLLVSHNENIIWEKVYGRAENIPTPRTLTPEHLFDIASLTKPIATTTLLMMAYEEGLVTLQETLDLFYPGLHHGGITIDTLLNHQSGLPAWKNYYDVLVGRKGHSPLQAILQDIDTHPPTSIHQQDPDFPRFPPRQRVIYSDLGYILLGNILEKIYQKSLDVLFQEKIAKPWGLQNTSYNPQLPHNSFVASEECPLRKKVLCGEVMDEHAWLMGGVAGHAGLFSTARDIHRWLKNLESIRVDRSPFLNKKTFEHFHSFPLIRSPEKRFFTLGLDTPTRPSSSGKYFSDLTLGHLGFTGTSFWWDLEKDFWVILLTNRVHPTRTNEKIKSFRPQLHDRIFETLFPK